MNYDEIIKKLRDPDHIAEGLADLEDYHKEARGQIEALTEKNKQDEARIADLQKTQMQLFLRITGKDSEEEEDDRTDYEKMYERTRNAFNKKEAK